MVRSVARCMIAGLAAIFAVGLVSHSDAQAYDVVTLPTDKLDKPFGSIIVDTSERRLYYVLGNGRAIKYAVAVGSPRNQWYATTFVSSKVVNPGWSPTPSMRRRNPYLPVYVAPGPRNPLGVRALYLDWGTYRIHGTNAPWSIGRAVSNGCIRMRNKDVIDLFERVHVGAPVFVVR